MKSLIESKIKSEYKIVKIKDFLSLSVCKRLKELGIVSGSKIFLLYKNNIAKSGIVRVMGSLISLDYNILSSIEVE